MCSTEAPVCSAKDQTLQVQITAANSDASFVCGGIYNIRPTDPTKVFQGDSCINEADLNSLVPGASIATTAENGLTKLSVNNLPDQPTKLCYRCEDDSQNICKVLVTVAASPSNATRLAAQATLGALLAVAGLMYMA